MICNYTIRAVEGANITLTFIHFDLEDERNCDYDSLEVFTV
jgi:hypothetical protein